MTTRPEQKTQTEKNNSNSKLEEFVRRGEELEEIVDDQVKRNSRSNLVIRGIKLNRRNEKNWNGTENTLTNIFCIHFGWSKDQFLNNIDRAHRENYKNSNSPIYVKFQSWKIARIVLHNIIKTNITVKINVFAG